MPVTAPDPHAWNAYTPWQAAERLAGAGAPWCVVGGWAIELWLGHRTREHSDLEVAVPRSSFDRFRGALLGLELFAPAGDDGMVHLGQYGWPPEGRHQVWALDLDTHEWRMDVMLEPGDVRTWVARRDETISMPRSAAVRWRDGVPYLTPEAVLLFKAKHMRKHDVADLRACMPTLADAQRRWLANAIEKVHPGHEWVALLLNAC